MIGRLIAILVICPFIAWSYKDSTQVINNVSLLCVLRTGYCGSESFLLEVVKVVKELKEVNPSLIFVCDPVLGDNGQFYVPQSLLPVYQKQLLPISDLITPNTFEAE